MPKIEDWLIYALCCSLLYGFWGFFGKLATQYIDYNTAFVYEAIGAILATSFIIVKTNNFSLQGDWRGIIFALAIGLCATIASLLFLIAIGKGPVTSVISITSIYPIVAVFLSFIFLKEPITFFQTIALFLAVIAVILSGF